MNANHRADLYIAGGILFATLNNQLHLAMVLVVIWIALNNLDC